MSEKVNETASAQAVKKTRRGISNQTQAVAQLKFHEKDSAPNGLFIGHLHRVSVDWASHENGAFAGLKVPRLVFEFCSNHAVATEMRHVYYNLTPVESNVNTIPGGSEEWKVNLVLNGIKHMLDIYYLKGRQLTEEEEDALSLPFEDFDENGQYVAIDAQTIVNGYTVLFTNVANIFNGIGDGNDTPKPIYKTADGKFINVWLKLIRYKKRKQDWTAVNNGDLAFDPFLGSGIVEIQKGNNPPAILQLDLSKESITPKETKKTPTIGGQAPMMGGVMPGSPMNAGMPSGGAYNETVANGEMPF